MFIGVPLVGRRIFRVSISDEEIGESEIPKEVWIRQIFGSGGGVPGWVTPEGYYRIMRATRDIGSLGYNVILYSPMY